MAQLEELEPASFAARLAEIGCRRAWFVPDPAGGVRASHPQLRSIAEALATNARDYDRHDAVFLEIGRRRGAVMGAFLHRTIRGQGIGGVRLWGYESVADMLRDGLRLSWGMGRKNALAGLWWGGGKGVIARPKGSASDNPEFRAGLFADFGEFITSLAGSYVTAEDVGTAPQDMEEIYRYTRFVACVPPAIGGSGNPSPATARGVVCAMEAALDFRGLGSIEGKRVAMQGGGNVGGYMIPLLLERGAKSIVVAEVSKDVAEKLAEAHGGAPVEVRVVDPPDRSILSEPCDVLAPNALGGILSSETIAGLRCKIVCGAANNQLLSPGDALALAERGITYVPDFVANRMGIVNCANEQYGSIEGDPAIVRHYGREWEGSVFNVTRRVLQQAEREKITTAEAAALWADELAAQPHPIFGARTRALIDALVSGGWAMG